MLSPCWVNRELIASGKIAQHMNAVGGEDRIRLDPEGGQFSIFFAPGVPYHGDVTNTYNDGPAALGERQLGHFYELEPSSPVRELKSCEALEHTHRPLHFEGTELQLDAICQRTLGVRLADVRSFNP
jgi:hypothetical protein